MCETVFGKYLERIIGFSCDSHSIIKGLYPTFYCSMQYFTSNNRLSYLIPSEKIGIGFYLAIGNGIESRKYIRQRYWVTKFLPVFFHTDFWDIVMMQNAKGFFLAIAKYNALNQKFLFCPYTLITILKIGKMTDTLITFLKIGKKTDIFITCWKIGKTHINFMWVFQNAKIRTAKLLPTFWFDN